MECMSHNGSGVVEVMRGQSDVVKVMPVIWSPGNVDLPPPHVKFPSPITGIVMHVPGLLHHIPILI